MQGYCPFGSVAEHSLGKGEVPGPIPGMGTILVLIVSLDLPVDVFLFDSLLIFGV